MSFGQAGLRGLQLTQLDLVYAAARHSPPWRVTGPVLYQCIMLVLAATWPATSLRLFQDVGCMFGRATPALHWLYRCTGCISFGTGQGMDLKGLEIPNHHDTMPVIGQAGRASA